MLQRAITAGLILSVLFPLNAHAGDRLTPVSFAVCVNEHCGIIDEHSQIVVPFEGVRSYPKIVAVGGVTQGFLAQDAKK